MRYVLIALCLFVLSSYKKVPYSISDNDVYPALCERASVDSLFFERFKQDPYYNLIMEYHTYEEGLEDLEYIRTHYPALLERIEKLRTNDAIGGPRLYEYDNLGRVSPTTLHYIKLAGDIQQQFGSLEGWKVVEIGCGYGGLCKILSNLFAFESYTLVDLPEPLALAKKVLSMESIERIRFFSPDTLKKESYDLVLSNYGFSECDRKAQLRFIEKIFSSAKKGYLACDFYPKHFKVRPLAKEDLIKKLRQHHPALELKNEEPQLGKNHFIILWK